MRVNRPASVTLLALAALLIVFVATWVTIPAGRYETKNLTTGQWETAQVGYPAKLLRRGLRSRQVGCPGAAATACSNAQTVRLRTDLDALRSRTLVAFGAVAAAILLAGVALGALRGY